MALLIDMFGICFEYTQYIVSKKNNVEMYYLNSTLTASIGIPVISLLKGRQTSNWSNCSTKLLNAFQIKHLSTKKQFRVNLCWLLKINLFLVKNAAKTQPEMATYLVPIPSWNPISISFPSSIQALRLGKISLHQVHKRHFQKFYIHRVANHWKSQQQIIFLPQEYGWALQEQ